MLFEISQLKRSNFLSRLDKHSLSSLTIEQRALLVEITQGARANLFNKKSLKTGSDFGGPFDIMIRSPKLGKLTSRLGEQLRFHSKLPPPLIEFLVLLVAANWHCEYEWQVHSLLALDAGLDAELIEQVKGQKILNVQDLRISSLQRLFNELNNEKKVSEETFQSLLECFSENEIIEATAIIGYYTTLAIWLTTFDIVQNDGANSFEK